MNRINDLSKESNRVLFKTRFLMPSLGKAEKLAASYLLQHPEEVSTSRITEYAKKSNVSQATIVRLCKSLGYKGFTEMKSKLTKELGAINSRAPVYPELQENDGFLSLASQIVQTSIQALNDTLTILEDSNGSKAVEVLSQARKVYCYGLGDAGDVARAARHKFLRLGYEAQAPADADVQLMTASLLGKGDVAIGISHSGRSRPIVDALKIAQKQGASTICLTNAPESPITKVSDIELFTAASISPAAENEVIARRVAELCIIDILFVGIINADKEKRFENLRSVAKVLKKYKI